MSDDLRPSFRGGGHSIDLDTVILPEIVVEDTALPADNILKAIFDLVWNACGYPSSKDFDANGNWNRR